MIGHKARVHCPEIGEYSPTFEKKSDRHSRRSERVEYDSIANQLHSLYISSYGAILVAVNPQPQRILIVRTDRIGDVILTLPMAQALKRNLPGVIIGMLIQRYTSELVELNPSVDHILYYDDGTKPLSFFALVRFLRVQHYNVVFHTHPRFRLALTTAIARIPIRVGTGYRWYSFLFNRKVFEHRKVAERHELEYNLHLLGAIGCAAGDEDRIPRLEIPAQDVEKVRRYLKGAGINEGSKIVIIHPGSGRSARDWPAGNFGSLARRLSALKSVRVIVTGGKGEEQLVDEVQSRGGAGVVSIVDKFSLREFGALAQLSSLFIANSTGPLHLAATVGAPVIGLYPQVTALSAARWGPYTPNKTIFSPVGKPSNCVKCLRGTGECECMSSISVEDVYRASVSYLVAHD